MITTEIMKKDSKLVVSWTDDTNVTLDKSTIVVIFADDIDKVGTFNFFLKLFLMILTEKNG